MITFKIKYLSIKNINNYLRDRWISIGKLEKIFNTMRHGNEDLYRRKYNRCQSSMVDNGVFCMSDDPTQELLILPAGM